MAAQGVMNLIDQPQCQRRIVMFSGGSRQAEIVADREGVCPQVAPGWTRGAQPGALRKVLHECNRLCDSRIRHASDLRRWQLVFKWLLIN